MVFFSNLFTPWVNWVVVSNIFYFLNPIWGRFPFWRLFFQMGWNHQLVNLLNLLRLFQHTELEHTPNNKPLPTGHKLRESFHSWPGEVFHSCAPDVCVVVLYLSWKITSIKKRHHFGRRFLPSASLQPSFMWVNAPGSSDLRGGSCQFEGQIPHRENDGLHTLPRTNIFAPKKMVV